MADILAESVAFSDFRHLHRQLRKLAPLSALSRAIRTFVQSHGMRTHHRADLFTVLWNISL